MILLAEHGKTYKVDWDQILTNKSKSLPALN